MLTTLLHRLLNPAGFQNPPLYRKGFGEPFRRKLQPRRMLYPAVLFPFSKSEMKLTTNPLNAERNACV